MPRAPPHCNRRPRAGRKPWDAAGSPAGNCRLFPRADPVEWGATPMPSIGPVTPHQFIAKWTRADLSERSAYQQHFLDLCELLAQPKPAEVDPKGLWYTFEKGVEKTDGGKGWADVWMQKHFGWEYKGRHKDLRAAYQQLLKYREALDNPPLLVVCDLDRIEIHSNFTGTAKRVHAFDLAGLAARGVGTVRYPRTVPGDAATADKLKKRTLTNLHNESPTWLLNAHRRLDEAVFAAYGWPPALSDGDILARQLERDLSRRAGRTRPRGILSRWRGGAEVALTGAHWKIFSLSFGLPRRRATWYSRRRPGAPERRGALCHSRLPPQPAGDRMRRTLCLASSPIGGRCSGGSRLGAMAQGRLRLTPQGLGTRQAGRLWRNRWRGRREARRPPDARGEVLHAGGRPGRLRPPPGRVILNGRGDMTPSP